MKLANGITALKIEGVSNGNPTVIYPTLIWDDKSIILIDTGYPGQTSLFQDAIAQAGADFNKLNTIILTHQDVDHIGSLSGIQEALALPAEVLANEIEKPYIQGNETIIKFAKVYNNLESIPEDRREGFLYLYNNLPKGEVHRTVADQEELPYCGGIVVINTPGHTPGHISLYHKPSKTLIAGDALFYINDELVAPPANFTLDMDAAMKSVQKLTEYDIETIICYHGGAYSDNVNQRIAELANLK
ncbi:MBL fold metallo-hydrolase [Paenibacillus sp. N1-5-1-14]|uniref:MBL fold metallo-hydrolase n=1 Tax=Paenibacillus radicibacter TaxID=2972488 RepID=UPI002159616E|nr:MBL fold metallo-hydrolase [Paenibacillus radicibacter]MCR8644527.1 MBL fold metallo-hydrolase [Paenibacillus radicibacter]